MKLKSLIVFAILFFAFTLSGMAQDKYETAIVRTWGFSIEVVTKDGVQTINMVKGEDADVKLVQKVNELSNDGWEIVNADFVASSQGNRTNAYFLKRKLK